MHSTVVYDGLCNLCVNLVQVLERVDAGRQFWYVPMQDAATLANYQVVPAKCEAGMLLIEPGPPERRYQGSAAAERIGELLPGGESLMAAYRALPGLPGFGDACYVQVRDNRYDWFGRRTDLYRSAYPPASSEKGTRVPL